MSKTISVTLTDALYACARDEALKQGRADGRTDGVSSLMRGTLRAHLNRNGYKAEQLDAPDNPVPEGAAHGD